MTLPPVLEDTRDLLLCLYVVLTANPVQPDVFPLDRYLRLGWQDAPAERKEARWLAELIWSDIIRTTLPLATPGVLARVINSFEGP